MKLLFVADQLRCGGAAPLLRARYGLTRADLVIGQCALFREG